MSCRGLKSLREILVNGDDSVSDLFDTGDAGSNGESFPLESIINAAISSGYSTLFSIPIGSFSTANLDEVNHSPLTTN